MAHRNRATIPAARLIRRLLDYPGRGTSIIPTPHKAVFLTLFFAIFSTVTGVGIVVPLLPVYANDLGAAGIYVGMIFGAFSISRSFLLPLFGRWSDFRGRKPFIVSGLLVYVLVSAAFIFSESVESLILIRFVQGAASAMILPVVQAYVGEITPEGSEGYSMGLFNLSMFLSLSLGPLMGGVIKDAWSLDAAFTCMGVLSAAGLALCFFLLPPAGQEQVRKEAGRPRPWSVLFRDRALSLIFLFRYAYTACIGMIWCFIPVYADTRFELSSSRTGFLVMLGVFISGILQLPMGWLADRWHRKRLIVLGGILSSLGMTGPFFAAGFMDLVWSVALFGVGGGIAMPSVMALAVARGEAHKAMGSVMSVITVAHSLGMFTGSMAAGLAMDYFTLKAAFPLGSLIMGTGTLVFLFLAGPGRAGRGEPEGS